jgi:hypothetical protein
MPALGKFVLIETLDGVADFLSQPREPVGATAVHFRDEQSCDAAESEALGLNRREPLFEIIHNASPAGFDDRRVAEPARAGNAGGRGSA